jgi:hypothetical protein
MRRTLLALPLAALAIVASPTVNAAQATKVVRGTVTAIGAASVTIQISEANMTFSVDDKTLVEAVGAGTKARQASSAGKPGLKLTDVVKTGQPVEVSYHGTGAKLRASRIRAVSGTGVSGRMADAAPAARTSTGTVKSLSGNALTISGTSGGGATFSQTFTVDGTTKVIGKGVGTAVAQKSGKDAFTDLVRTGDHVSVSYNQMGGTTLHAAEVRITLRAGGTK